MKQTFKIIEYEISNQSKWTFDIKAIEAYLNKQLRIIKKDKFNKFNVGTILNVFAGKNYIKKTETLITYNNDLSTEFKADYHMEALEFLKQYNDDSVDAVIFDPPFNLKLHKKLYQGTDKYKNYGQWIWALKMEIARVLKVGGVCLSCGYETNGIGSIKGFEKENLLIVAHGGLLRDTFVYTEKKIISGKHYNTWENNND